ncbi:hypothetical protein [Luteimonas fraxinea]|uniref:Uncharacterized protein n=1 Tax=Luteimonas fraxinea TaxID=2901869 RepID=A0ABS8UBG0_9GAMM|nr:hypothetical protein [Luteimonas fraxinea]MCD9096212.1 hypothetical protein [Luteimonas fraxinea]
MKGTLLAVMAVATLALAPKIASAQSVTISCETENFCVADASGFSYDTLSWHADTSGTGAIFPANCTNQNFCSFYCLSYPGTFSMTVNYSLNGQIIGSATAQARCVGEVT